jgi:hypothetical protein
MRMAWFDAILIKKHREVRVTFCPAATTVNFNADATRVHLRLLWMQPGGMALADQARATITGVNNVGTSIRIPILEIRGDWPVDEMSAENYGYLVQSQLQVENNAAFDCALIEVLLK